MANLEKPELVPEFSEISNLRKRTSSKKKIVSPPITGFGIMAETRLDLLRIGPGRTELFHLSEHCHAFHFPLKFLDLPGQIRDCR